MLAKRLLREKTESVRGRLIDRGVAGEVFDRWVDVDRERRATLVELEKLKQQRNESSKAIGRMKQKGEDAAAQIEEVGRVKGEIATREEKLAAKLRAGDRFEDIAEEFTAKR